MLARSALQHQQHDFTFDLKNPDPMISFLRQRMVTAGVPLGHRYIHLADPYSAPPADLVRYLNQAPRTQAWYLLYSRLSAQGRQGSTRHQNRKVVSSDGEERGFWRADQAKKDVLDAGRRIVGYSRTLYYWGKTKTTTSPVKIGWSMVEFWLEQQNGADQQLFLCKVYESNPKKYRAARHVTAEEGGASVGEPLAVPMTTAGAEAGPVAPRPPHSNDDSQMPIRVAGTEAAAAPVAPRPLHSNDDSQMPIRVAGAETVAGEARDQESRSMGNTNTELLLVQAANKALSCDMEKACEIDEFVLVKKLHLRTIDELGLDRSIVSD